MNFESVVQWLISFIRNAGVWGVFLGTIIEEVIAPIPSPVILMAAGAVLLSHHDQVSESFLLDFINIVFWGALGGTIGALVPFGIFFVGGKEALTRFGKFFGISWSQVEKFQKKLNNSFLDELSIFFFRSLPVMPSILIAAGSGILRLHPVKFMLLFWSGGMIRSSIFVFMGWQLAETFWDQAKLLESISDIILKLTLVALFIVMIILFIKRYKENL